MYKTPNHAGKNALRPTPTLAPALALLFVSLLCSCSLPTIDLDGVARKKDTVAPVVAVDSPREAALCANILEIRGRVSDVADGGAAGQVSSLGFSVLGTAIKGSVATAPDGSFSFILDASTAGTSYTVELVAEDWNGNRGALSLRLARGASAGIPSLAATGSSKRIDLAWEGIPRTRGYTLYYTKDGTPPSAANHAGSPLSIAADATSFTLGSCENGTLYTFLLVSEPEPGLNPCLSDFVRAIPLSERSLAPQASGLKGRIRVSWPEIPGSVDFSLWRSETGAPGSFVKVAEVTGNAYIDGSTQPGQAYFYSVQPSRYAAVRSVSAFAKEAIESGSYSSSSVGDPALLQWGAQGLAADESGGYLYVSGDSGWIAVLDIRDRTSPTQVTKVRPILHDGSNSVKVKSLFVSGAALYCVAEGSSGQESLVKYGIANPAAPVVAAGFIPRSLSSGGTKPNMAMAGGFLCVTGDNASVSIHDPASGGLKSTYSPGNYPKTSDVAVVTYQVSGVTTQYLVTANVNAIDVASISNLGTATGKARSSYLDGSGFEFLAASGATVFAGGYGGTTISVFDGRYIHNGSLTKLGEIAIDGGLSSGGLRVVGTKLVACSLKGMLYYYDIGDPSRPFLVGATPQLGPSIALAAADQGTVYARWPSGLMVNLDSNQYARPISTQAIPIHPVRMALWGERLYVVGKKGDGSGHLAHLDLSAQAPTVRELALVTCPNPSDLAVSGPRAYVASLADSQGLGAVVDLTDPAAPRLMTGRVAGGRHQGIGLYGETAITTASTDALIGFDISEADAPPGPPSSRVTGLLGHAYSRIWMEGSYAYTLLGQSVRSLQMVDLRDSSLRSSGAVTGEFCVHGGYLYARQPKGADMGLAVFGLDKPDEPVLRGYAVHNELLSPQGDDPQGILGMAASGDYVFVANGAKGLARFNVANPAAPYYAGSLVPNGMTSVWEVAVSGATLVVAGDTATGHAVAVYSLKP